MSRRLVVSAVVARGGRLLLTQRAPEGSFPWSWETPGGKVEEGETPEQALQRELREELDVEAIIGPALASIDLDPPLVSQPYRMTFYLVSDGSGTATARVAVGLGRFTPAEIAGLELTPGTGRVREMLMQLAGGFTPLDVAPSGEAHGLGCGPAGSSIVSAPTYPASAEGDALRSHREELGLGDGARALGLGAAAPHIVDSSAGEICVRCRSPIFTDDIVGLVIGEGHVHGRGCPKMVMG